MKSAKEQHIQKLLAPNHAFITTKKLKQRGIYEESQILVPLQDNCANTT